MKKIFLACFVLPLAFAACNKDKDKGTPDPVDPIDTVLTVPVSKFTILTTDKWKLTEAFVNNTAGELAIDYYSTMKDCEKDNFFFFNASGSITLDEGATKCSASDPQTTTDGNWSFSADTSKMTLSGSSLLPVDGDHTIKILTLTATTLKVSKDTTITYPGFPAMSGTFIASMIKVK